MAGMYAGLFPLYVYYVLKAAPAFKRSMAPIVEVRRRPDVLFVVGLAAMTVVWSLISTAELVLSGVEIPWTLAYCDGFFMGFVSIVVLGYALFLSHPFLRVAAALTP